MTVKVRPLPLLLPLLLLYTTLREGKRAYEKGKMGRRYKIREKLNRQFVLVEKGRSRASKLVSIRQTKKWHGICQCHYRWCTMWQLKKVSFSSLSRCLPSFQVFSRIYPLVPICAFLQIKALACIHLHKVANPKPPANIWTMNVFTC